MIKFTINAKKYKIRKKSIQKIFLFKINDYLCNVNNKQIIKEDKIMITTIVTRRTKSFKDICSQCERIFSMHLHGYGSDKMLEMVETIFFKVIEKTGY